MIRRLLHIPIGTLLRALTSLSVGSTLALGVIYLVPWSAIAQVSEVGQMVTGLAEGLESAAGGSLVKGLLVALILSQAAILGLIWTGGKYLITIARKPETFNSDAALVMMKETLWGIYKDIRKEERIAHHDH